MRNFERLRERRVQFTIGLPPDTPAEKLARVPDILREAIEAQFDARFERAHFKEFGKDQLLFEAAYYVSDRDYNRYMDIQQAINLAVYARLQQEAIAPMRKPSPEPGASSPGGKTQPRPEGVNRVRPAARTGVKDRARQREDAERARERQAGR